MYVSFCSNYGNANDYMYNKEHILENGQQIRIILLCKYTSNEKLYTCTKQLPHNLVHKLNHLLIRNPLILLLTSSIVRRELNSAIRDIDIEAYHIIKNCHEHSFEVINDDTAVSFSCCVVLSKILTICHSKGFEWKLYNNYTVLNKSKDNSYLIGDFKHKVSEVNGIYFINSIVIPEPISLNIAENTILVIHSEELDTLDDIINDIIINSIDSPFFVSKQIVKTTTKFVMFLYVKF